MDMNLNKLQEKEDRGAWCAATHGVSRVGHNLVTQQQQQVELSSYFNPGYRTSSVTWLIIPPKESLSVFITH